MRNENIVYMFEFNQVLQQGCYSVKLSLVNENTSEEREGEKLN